MQELRGLQSAVREIYVDSTVADYIVRIVARRGAIRTSTRRLAARVDRALSGQALAGLLGRTT